MNLWFPHGIVADAYRASAPERRLPAVAGALMMRTVTAAQTARPAGA
ncbi:hypothetical protein [Streptomyces sp. NRRL F-2799]|nr:hypothetical protein [Streptomyces sp. NRRL F-2799]